VKDRPTSILDFGKQIWMSTAIHPALKSHFSSNQRLAIRCGLYSPAFGYDEIKQEAGEIHNR
jgi:hypothetical protein